MGRGIILGPEVGIQTHLTRHLPPWPSMGRVYGLAGYCMRPGASEVWSEEKWALQGNGWAVAHPLQNASECTSRNAQTSMFYSPPFLTLQSSPRLGVYCLPLAVQLLWGDPGSLLPSAVAWERTSHESGNLGLSLALHWTREPTCPSLSVLPL